MENKEFEYSEANIVKLLHSIQRHMCTSYDVMIPNCYTSHDNEADIFAIRKSGLCDEFEVKISRSDFFNDAKKIVAFRNIMPYDHLDQTSDHVWLDENYSDFHKKKAIAPWQKLKYEALKDGDMSTNYFWYAIKDGIVEIDEIPEFAGVIVVKADGDFIIKRRPKKLHNNKMPFDERFRLARKLGYRFWDLLT